MFFFQGSFVSIRSLDAANKFISFSAGDNSVVANDLYFSVREDHLMIDNFRNPLYVHKGDIVVYHLNTGSYEIILEGKFRGIMGIDALSAVEFFADGIGELNIIFSTTHDSYIGNGPGQPLLFSGQKDLVKYNPGTGTFEIYMRGQDIGIRTLDGVDVVGSTIYYSVRKPAYVNRWPFPFVYLKDGDVGAFDTITKTTSKYFTGKSKGLTTIDALYMSEPLL